MNLWDELGIEPQDEFDKLIENFNKNKFYVTDENMENLRLKCEKVCCYLITIEKKNNGYYMKFYIYIL